MNISLRSCLIFAAAAAVISVVLGGSAQAQIFCPPAISFPSGTQTGIMLQGGNCTNNTTGAFSNATMASQALSDLSQSTTQETTRTATNAISERRQTEAERCPEGFERVNGVCRRPVAAEVPPAPVSSSPAAPADRAARHAKRERRAAPIVASPRAPVYKAPPLPIVDEGVRVAAWAHVFGDYERRNGTGITSIVCCTAAFPPAGLPNPLNLSETSVASTVGFLSGLDLTSRNLLTQGDGLIAGMLFGYAETDMKLSATSTTTTATVGSGSSILNARISGPSVGVYATYFNGPFSIDNTLKADFLSLSESFTDNLAFTANAGVNPAFATFSSAGSTNLTNLSSFGNVNYRFRLSEQYWIEPTAGYNYTSSHYDSNAALLGLSDGYLLRLQAGARFGVESFWNQVRVTTILTGLAYDDAIINGGVIQNAAFGANTLLLADEGKIRGEGILAVNLDFGRGLSTFVLADVRGGEGLFGAGGKAGVRYQW